ncbi:MAG TPA: caspase family protein, partial [Bradyrhizobium sp.]|nr:caspase family protein [Bradyrhizobium sp.]
MKISGIRRTLETLVLCAIVAGSFFSEPFFLSAARGEDVSLPQAGKRIALVIGNGSYPLSPVRTAVADAKAIAELLKAGGFDVIYSEDAQH